MSLAHRHPIFPRVYPYISRGAEEGGAADRRRELFAGLQGRVMEVAAGHGLNFACKIHCGKRIAFKASAIARSVPHILGAARRA
jgi:hypothetical protein